MARTITMFLVFIVSLLSVFPAPTYHTWLLSIAVTEYPLIFIFLTLLLLIPGFWFHEYPLWINIAGAAALILFLSPIIRAYAVGGNLESGLESSFGKIAHPAGNPFSFGSMIRFNKTGPSDQVAYKKLRDKNLTLDFYCSAIAGKRPTVIVIHGGSWSTGDSRQLPEMNTYLSGIGYHVAALNYRLSPKYQNPAPAEDVRDAISFLKSKSDSLQIDTTNIVLLGRSAGGQIALLAGYTLHDPSIKGVIDFYGPADMVWGYSLPSNPWVMDSRSVMENYLGGTYAQHPGNYEASSPILFAGQQSPATLLIHGKNDVLVAYEHSRRLNEKLQQNGVKHYFLSIPWGTHGFDYNLNGPGGQLATYAVTYFLKSVTY